MSTIKNLSVSIILTLFALCAYAQDGAKYFTKEGHISFHSETKIETIEAENYKATSILDVSTGQLEFKVLIKAFEFEKALMQEHFNENYMESDEYPKSNFKGKITNIADVDFATDGTYDVAVTGDLTIHGVTNTVETAGKIIVEGGEIKAASNFVVKPADYKINIPTVVVDNIAEEITVKVDLDYKLFNR